MPGVIAFAVDFSNGTIYLPPDQYGSRISNGNEKRLVGIRIPQKRLTIQVLEKVVSAHTELEIQLVPGEYHTEELEQLDDFWNQTARLGNV